MQRYLDYNASCPPVRESLSAWSAAAEQSFGNASSAHWAGRSARRVLDQARDRLAAFIGGQADSIVFTSGGTEANNFALHGWLSEQPRGRIIASAIEHASVLRPLQRYASDGWEVVLVAPDDQGVTPADAMINAMSDNTRMVCLMAANNETGAMQPVQAVGQACRERNIPVRVDAVQMLGKAPIDVTSWQADFVSFSAHKIGGPKGVGAIVIDSRRQLSPLILGGGQERGRRSGTENVAGVAGFAAALGVADFPAVATIRDAFEQRLAALLPDTRFFSASVPRLPNTSMFGLPGFDGETLLMQLDLAGFAVASGSACSSGLRSASHVLLAMGCSQEEARASVRVSFGPDSTGPDAEALVEELCAVRNRLLAMAGLA